MWSENKMHNVQYNKITTPEWIRSQIKDYPDSEEKRLVQNLAEKIQLFREGIIHPIKENGDYTKEFMKRQEQFL
jgi:hypothetical protein